LVKNNKKFMRRGSSIERIVGAASEEVKQEAEQYMAERFESQPEKLSEREKTPEELEMIDLANKASDMLRRKYGLEDFYVPPKNVHAITDPEWFKKRHSEGFYHHSGAQAIFISSSRSKIAEMSRLFHEMLHFKSYNAMQLVEKGDSRKLMMYRGGLSVQPMDMEKGRLFRNLNEGMTEELTKRNMRVLIHHPLFKDELLHMQDVGRRIPPDSPMLDDNDIYYAYATSRQQVGMIENNEEKTREGKSYVLTEKFGYPRQRKALNILVDKLFEKNKDKFKNREEVFEIFARGYMTGNIMPIGRMIEKTFGKGTFRKIGEMDNDIDEQEKFIDSL